jgi:DNA ligase-associated metallophosphoesterase
MMQITVKGELLSLMPERAAFWHRERALLIADPHWGKAATFRAGGIPVPGGTTKEAINRLDELTTTTNAREVIFLGDLLHAKAGRSASMFAALDAWRSNRNEIKVTLVRGNHDKRAGDPPEALRFDCVDAPHAVPPFVFAHHPTVSDEGYVIAGHVHPGITLYGPARQRERLPCFAFGRDSAILPAFGDFTGLAAIDPEEWETIYAVADDRVISVVTRSNP